MVATPPPNPTETDPEPTMQAVPAGPNRLVISQEALDCFPETRYFDVTIANGKIVLTPAQDTPIEEVWEHIASLGLTEDDIADAITWARNS